MLTSNVDITDKLVNGFMCLHRVRNNKNAQGTVYVKFDNPHAGDKRKDRRLEMIDPALKGVVPITPLVKEFNYKKKKLSRTQFPLILAHGMTIHKSQGGTYDYFELNLDRTCKTPNYKAPVQRGLVYTGLSRGQDSNHINLTNVYTFSSIFQFQLASSVQTTVLISS